MVCTIYLTVSTDEAMLAWPLPYICCVHLQQPKPTADSHLIGWTYILSANVAILSVLRTVQLFVDGRKRSSQLGCCALRIE